MKGDEIDETEGTTQPLAPLTPLDILAQANRQLARTTDDHDEYAHRQLLACRLDAIASAARGGDG